ncbi:MAG: CBS domain-containing protein [Candidatus Sericytochromatia bacterium]|nr:CBS domain-containing protein [Candidatus Tanganyikabacteria bacterium]
MATVGELMTRDVTTVPPDATVHEMLRIWDQRHFGAFPVVADGRLVGIVTEGDLLYKESPIRPPVVLALLDALIPIGGGRKLDEDVRKHAGYRAKDLMSAPVLTVGPDEDAARAARIMVDRKIKHLPVVDARGTLLGILSRRDLLHHLVQTLA